MTAMVQSGAEVLLQCLINHGVEVVFAYPGGATLPLHQALTRVKDRLRTLLPRHEQGGGFAASGYARSSGKVGVCFATSGPGATNLVTCLADAMREAVPMIAVTGQVNRPVLGTDAFQEIPIVSVCRSITKHHYLVTRVEDISRVMREALHVATTGRPGPVLVDVPKDLQARKITADYSAPLRLPGYRPELQPHVLPSPPLRGRGVGGEGDLSFAKALTPSPPSPLPRSTGGEGRRDFGPEAVVRCVWRYLRDHGQLERVFVTTGAGPARDWVAGGFRFLNPRQWIASRSVGAVGFALPAAIGVQAAYPNHTVLAVEDAPGMLANVHELACAYCERLPIKVLVLNEQSHDSFPDFATLAQGFQVRGVCVSSEDDFEAGLDEWVHWDGPSLLHVRLARSENMSRDREGAEDVSIFAP